MTAPPPPEPPRPARPTSHRAKRPAPEVLRRLGPPLVSVVAVTVVILLLLVLNSRPSHSGPAPGAVAAPPSAPTVTPDTSAAASATSATPTARARAAATAAAPPVNEPPATQPPAVPRPPVTVLNNSRRQGLAAHVAGEVRAKGWPVRETGNFTGRIAMTTVYYASGQQAAAEALAHALPQIRRVEPRFDGLPGAGLTLVVTRDWTG